MSKRTLFLIFALFIITLVLLMMALYKPSSPKPVQTVTAPKEPVAQTTLTFGNLAASASSSIKQSALQTYSLPIQITTEKNKVTAVQLELQYDPKILSNVSVSAGSFFNNPDVLLNQIDAKTGRISYAFGVPLTEQGVIGQGVVATLTFETKAETPQETTILFLPKTLVTAEGINQSVLKTTNNAVFTVGIVPTTPNISSPSAR